MLALLPIIAALAPLAGRLLGNAISGKDGQQIGETVARQASAAAVQIFGTDEPEKVNALALADPVKAAEFRERMEQLAVQVQLATMQSDLANVQGARENQRKLAEIGNWSSYAPTIISVVVLVGFFGILAALVWRPFAIDNGQREVLQVMLGALTVAFGSVTNYWLGSSHGSKAKDQALAEQASKAVEALKDRPASVPVPVPVPAPPPAPAPGAQVAPEPAKSVDWQQGPFGGVRWRLDDDGLLLVEGEAKPPRTVGAPITVRRIWAEQGTNILQSCLRNGVPLELVVATIATESSGAAAAARTEPDGRTSVGLMQTLAGTASEVMGRTVAPKELEDPVLSIEAGTRYIAKQYPTTRFMPPLVAAAYNAGGLHEPRPQDTNRWKLRSTGDHIDRFVQFYNDCVCVAREDGWARAVG